MRLRRTDRGLRGVDNDGAEAELAGISPKDLRERAHDVKVCLHLNTSEKVHSGWIASPLSLGVADLEGDEIMARGE